MEKLNVYAAKLVPKNENFAQGHRACQGCAEALALRQIGKAVGKNVITVSATGCMEVISSPFPYTSWNVPWIHVAFENAAAVASGVEAGLKAMMRKGRMPQRKIFVLALAGDGGTNDIGVQALSGALAAAHDIPYVATACPSYPFDLMEKVKRGARTPGPAYIHVLAVCPTGWRSAPDLSIRLGRLAVETGIFPLYEVVDGNYKMSIDPPKLRPVEEYFRLQGRFRHLTKDMIDTIQKRVQSEYERLKQRAKADWGG